MTKQQGSALKISIFIVYAISLLILSLIPNPPDILGIFSWIDKLEHFTAYLFLSLSMGSIMSPWKGKKTTLTVFFYSAAYGAIIEFLQQFTGRNPDVLDFFFDVIGSAIGIFIFTKLHKMVTEVPRVLFLRREPKNR